MYLLLQYVVNKSIELFDIAHSMNSMMMMMTTTMMMRMMTIEICVKRRRFLYTFRRIIYLLTVK